METYILPHHFPLLLNIQRLGDQLRYFGFEQQIYNSTGADAHFQNIRYPYDQSTILPLHTQQKRFGPIIYKHKQTTNEVMSILTIQCITRRDKQMTLTNGSLENQIDLAQQDDGRLRLHEATLDTRSPTTPSRILKIWNFPRGVAHVQIQNFLNSKIKYGNQIDIVLHRTDAPFTGPINAYIKLHSIKIAMETLIEIRQMLFQANSLSVEYFDLLHAPNQMVFPPEWTKEIESESTKHLLPLQSITTDKEILQKND